jgi:hypothetical protein
MHTKTYIHTHNTYIIENEGHVLELRQHRRGQHLQEVAPVQPREANDGAVVRDLLQNRVVLADDRLIDIHHQQARPVGEMLPHIVENVREERLAAEGVEDHQVFGSGFPVGAVPHARRIPHRQRSTAQSSAQDSAEWDICPLADFVLVGRHAVEVHLSREDHDEARDSNEIERPAQFRRHRAAITGIVHHA